MAARQIGTKGQLKREDSPVVAVLVVLLPNPPKPVPVLALVLVLEPKPPNPPPNDMFEDVQSSPSDGIGDVVRMGASDACETGYGKLELGFRRHGTTKLCNTELRQRYLEVLTVQSQCTERSSTEDVFTN